MSRISTIKRLHLLLLLSMVCTFLVYFSGLSGGFLFDDSGSLLNNESIRIDRLDSESLTAAAFSDIAGPLGRPISMLSFALNYYATGFDAWYLKLTNLAIHLLNGVALYGFLTLILSIMEKRKKYVATTTVQSYLALLVTTAWLLHPLALTSVLYVVQRMNSLATLFTLLGLLTYIHGRNRLDAGETGKGFALILAGVFGFGILAIFSKENGALLPVYALIVEAVLFRFQIVNPANRKLLIGFFTAAVGIPILAILTYTALKPGWIMGTYELRTFTLPERLLTESRIVWQYLKWIIMPANTELGLFHDDIAVSTGLLSPVTTLTSIIGFLLLLAGSFVARHRAPLVTFGILWFLVGHSLESTALPLELAHEHRNYLPMVGILLPGFQLLLSIKRNGQPSQLAMGAALATILLFGTSTALRANQWRDNISLNLSEVEHHPNSARTNYHTGRQYLILFDNDKENRGYYDKARYHFERAAALEKSSTLGLFGLISLYYVNHQTVEPVLISELRHRLATAPFGSFETNSLKLVSGYSLQEKPILPKRDIQQLFDGALSNKNLNPNARGMLFSMLSAYYANWEHAYQDAFLLANKAIEVAPNEAMFNANMANLLVSVSQYEIAQKQLEIARSKDISGKRAKEIASVERIIQEQLRGRKGNTGNSPDAAIHK